MYNIICNLGLQIVTSTHDMTQKINYESRHAIARARFFLAKARECHVDTREDFEAYLEASIVFARAAILRVKHTHCKKAGFMNWWSSLKNDPSVLFFKNHRDMILKEAPPRVGQKIQVPLYKVSMTIVGEPSEDIAAASIDEQVNTSRELPEEQSYASDLYYFDDPSISATDKVEEHLNKLEAHINGFINSLQAAR